MVLGSKDEYTYSPTIGLVPWVQIYEPPNVDLILGGGGGWGRLFDYPILYS